MRSWIRSLLVAAVSVSGVASSALAEPLKIAYSDWPGWSTLDVAQEKGFFKEAGVEVELVWMEYLPSMEAFAAGKVDAVTMTNGDAMVTGATGKPSTAVLLTDYSNGNDMIVGKSGVGSIKDLKGKKIGLELNLVEHLLLLKALEANGMTEADVTIVNTPTNDTPQVLASGGVDAVAAWYPIAGQTLKQVAGSKALYTSGDAKGLIYDGIFVSKESLAGRRADWVKVVAAYDKTVKFIKDPATKDEAVKIMAAHVQVDPKEYGPNMDGTYLLTVEESVKHFEKKDGLESVYGSSKVANDFNVKNKVYEASQDVNAYFDPSLVAEVVGKK